MHASALPTVDEVTELGTALSVIAPAEFEDENGHVNVGHFYRLHMDGADEYFRAHGFDDDYRERTGHSVFSTEHHIRFHDECLQGDELSVHLRLLGLAPKALHGMTVIVNRSRGTIANTLEFIELHVDLQTRRTTPMPDEMLSSIGPAVERHRALPWSLPLAGTMGVR